VAAAADLGGLGARTGPAVAFKWTRPSLLPYLLPWLALALLQVCPGNRGWTSGWVWLPLGLLVGFGCYAPSLFTFMPAAPLDAFSEIFQALAFGVAAVWLAGHYLARGSRFVGFAGTFGLLIGFSVLAFAVRQDWDAPEVAVSLVLMGVFTTAFSLALSLAGYICRGRYGPPRLTLWMLAGHLVVMGIAGFPFLLLTLAVSRQQALMQGLAFLAAVLLMALVSFLILLPFLLLAYASPFYRERLQRLLHLEAGQDKPPILAPSTS
jgi:hypothetical protein